MVPSPFQSVIRLREAAQVPGVGIVELSEDGRSGKLVDVLRTTNTIDAVPVSTITGGHDYTGSERIGVHGVVV